MMAAIESRDCSRFRRVKNPHSQVGVPANRRRVPAGVSATALSRPQVIAQQGVTDWRRGESNLPKNAGFGVANGV